MQALGLYAHIPFCTRRCDYCDFFVIVGRQDEGRFFEWLERDLDLGAAALGGGSVDTVYLGGGTPSLAEPARIGRLLCRVGEVFRLQPDAEITLEANPESVNPPAARAWRDAGVNRLSLGVQSFDDSVLPRRGRLYDARGAVLAVRHARESGFGNLGVDMIAGLPGETLKGFLYGIDRLIDLEPDHVSIYLLETEDALKLTPLARAVAERRETLPPEDDVLAMYEEGSRRLQSAGLEHYEISNFARPGRVSRHNLKYWKSEPWLGIGPSAHSHLLGRRFGWPADLDRWIDRVRAGDFPPPEQDYTLPEPRARAREALVMQLRLVEGVALEAFERRWGLDLAACREDLEDLSREGLVTLGSGRLALTSRGLLLSNEVFARLS